jgi:hypothetical protein
MWRYDVFAVFLTVILSQCGTTKIIYILPDGTSETSTDADVKTSYDLLLPEAVDTFASDNGIDSSKDMQSDFWIPSDQKINEAPQEVINFFETYETDYGEDNSNKDTSIPDNSFVFPDATDDCDPLGLPSKWKGTFDGETESNIPPVAGYTFEGPVNGEISFEIKCINKEYRIIGVLNGGSTNCALETGCPFSAKMWGAFNKYTGAIDGTLIDGVIDYSVAYVKAQGKFSGNLISGTKFEGIWSGESTDVILFGTSQPWVKASGSGTWEAVPDE